MYARAYCAKKPLVLHVPQTFMRARSPQETLAIQPAASPFVARIVRLTSADLHHQLGEMVHVVGRFLREVMRASPRRP
jgi:hypothetical protein